MAIVYSGQNRRNVIINGCFRNWARGDAQIALNGYHSDDRWYNSSGYTNFDHEFTKQTFALGHNDVPGNPKYYAMCYSGGVSSDPNFYVTKEQKIEDVRTLSGKVATLSFYAMSPYPTRNIGIELIQRFGTGSTSAAVVGIGLEVIQINNVWTRYIRTIPIPSVVGKDIRGDSSLAVKFWINSGSNYTTIYVGAAPYPIYLSNVQLESGSEATDFEYRTEFEEQTLCERYYEYNRSTSQGLSVGGVTEQFYIRFRQRKRGTPTMAVEDASSASNINTGIVNFNGIDKKGAKCWFPIVNTGKWYFNPYVSASSEL